MADYIDRQAALNALCDNCDTVQEVCPHFPCKRYTSVEALPSAQPTQLNTPNTLEALDCISRQAAIDAIDETDWYHQNRNGEMVHGANSAVHQAWYKADDIYKALNAVPSADAVEVVRCRDCKYYDLAKNGVNGICNRQYGTFDAYDFCSYGEKNEASRNDRRVSSR